MIPEVANHLISSGGKRLRPMLTLSTAALTGYRGEGHIRLAAAVEFMHTATLLHDDVVDDSEMRRGKLAARMLWGNEASVLVGDFLLGQAFRMMVEVGSIRALEILSTAAAVIAEGEVMQLAAAKNLDTTEDEYLAVIRAKTAELFAAACEVGPVLAARPKPEEAAARSFGMNLGIAFQLVDDALDYGGSRARLGKNVGDDFREGKITLPVILAFRRGNEEERSFWRRALEKGQSTDADLERAVGLLAHHRALEDTIERARHYGAIAKDALALFPEGQSKQALVEVVDFCVARALTQFRRRHPAVPVFGADHRRCLFRLLHRIVKREHARPRARHAHEPHARRACELLLRRLHERRHLVRRAREIVRLRIEKSEKLLPFERNRRGLRMIVVFSGERNYAEFVECLERFARRHMHFRKQDHAGELRQRKRRRQFFADTAHHTRFLFEADGDIGAALPRRGQNARVVEP
jgi:octaprenyl-diphosphate synthase